MSEFQAGSGPSERIMTAAADGPGMSGKAAIDPVFRNARCEASAPRSAALSTEIDNSSPIRWYGLYIAA